MLKHLYLILISTFVIGFISGVYIFFLTGGPSSTVPEGNEEIAVIVDMYGGCLLFGDACPSYHLDGTGEYIYITANQSGEVERTEGKLSYRERKEFLKLFQETHFSELKHKRFTGTCPAAFDGSAFRYRIVFGGDEFSFDSCKENLAGVELFGLLDGFFDEFENHS